jgi:hypothetical protein
LDGNVDSAARGIDSALTLKELSCKTLFSLASFIVTTGLRLFFFLELESERQVVVFLEAS